MKIKLTIYSLQGVENYNITKVSLPTYLGEITVLPNHQPLLCLLKKGKVIFWQDDKIFELPIEREAFARINQKEVEIFIT